MSLLLKATSLQCKKFAMRMVLFSSWTRLCVVWDALESTYTLSCITKASVQIFWSLAKHWELVACLYLQCFVVKV